MGSAGPITHRLGVRPPPSARVRRTRRSSEALSPSVPGRWRWSLSAGALAVRAPRPTAGPTQAILELLLCPANAACSGHLLFGILDPTDELVAGQRRDVLPGIECRGVGDQRRAQVSWKLVHHPTGQSRAAHEATVAGQPEHAGAPHGVALRPERRPGAPGPAEVVAGDGRPVA
jgi:hypothetical protein